jgi:hypothetical protein
MECEIPHSLPIVSKRTKVRALYVARFYPQVSVRDNKKLCHIFFS